MERPRTLWLRVGFTAIPLLGMIIVAEGGFGFPGAATNCRASEVAAVSDQLVQGGPPPGRGPGFGRGPGWGRGAGRGAGQGPGGPGADAEFVADRDVFHFLLDHHAQISRQVKHLPNGVETITESEDPDIASKIRTHVKAMYRRVEEGRPIHLRDPLFRAVFQHASQIQMEFQATDKGIRVTETSDDPYVAQLIQAHAAVVDGFVKNGFAEAHKNHEVPAQDAEQGASDDQSSAVVRVFGDFDAAYIPALALTNQGKQKPAEIAMQQLRVAWNTLCTDLDDMIPDDTAWHADKEAVRDAIGAAARQLQQQQLTPAHETLEEIRGRLSDLRRRREWSYDLDALNEFHETMEKIVKPAMERSASDIDETARRDLQDLLNVAERQWTIVEQNGFDVAARSFDDSKQRQLAEFVKKERQALTVLATALSSADAEQILQAARGLKPPFAQLYMSFGQFPTAP